MAIKDILISLKDAVLNRQKDGMVFQKNDTDKLHIILELIKAVGDAGKRVRFILIVIVTATILAFSSLWNTSLLSWNENRIRSLEELQLFIIDNDFFSYGNVRNCDEKVGDKASIRNLSSTLTGITWNVFMKRTEEKCRELLLIDVCNNSINTVNRQLGKIKKKLKIDISEYDRDEIESEFEELLEKPYKGAIKVVVDEIRNQSSKMLRMNDLMKYYRPHILGRDGLAQLLIKKRQYEDEQIKKIKIPFFNVSFDINDLGVLGGLSFSLLLAIFLYSLTKESENLKTIHFIIKMEFPTSQSSKYFYYLLSMQQLFSLSALPIEPEYGADVKKRVLPTVENEEQPDVILSKKKTFRIKKYLRRDFPKALYFLPTILFLFIIGNDLKTMNKAGAINMSHAWLTLIVSCFFLFVIIALSVRCTRVSRGIDKKWETIGKFINDAIAVQVSDSESDNLISQGIGKE